VESEPPEVVKKHYCGNCGREVGVEKTYGHPFKKCPHCGRGPITSKVVVKK